jgi:enamine deaminase RidA (YjgF/YER057c/UK114 family)
VRVGDLLFCSGQIPLDPATAAWWRRHPNPTEQVLHNIQIILEAEAGAKHIVKTTVS